MKKLFIILLFMPVALFGQLKQKSSETAFDDIQVSINNIVKGGTAPDDRLYDHGIGSGVTMAVLGFATGDYIYFDVQTSHAMKLSSPLHVHLHYILPNTTSIGHHIKWQLDVIEADIDGTFSVPTGSPFTIQDTVATGDNTNHLYIEIAQIPGVNTNVSTIYSCKLTRIEATATDYASEVYLKYIDCHYEKDSHGSFHETTKW